MSIEEASEIKNTRLEPDQWVDAFGDDLYRFAWRLLGDPNTAEEIVQDTFLAGLSAFHQFEGSGSQLSWLITILKRKILDRARAQARRDQDRLQEKETGGLYGLFDENGNWSPDEFTWRFPDERIQMDELQTLVTECLNKLPQGQADVFRLMVMHEMESNDICHQLQITVANLWIRMHRARLGMAKCVGAKWFDNEGAGNVK